MSRHRPLLSALILGAILASPAAAQQPWEFIGIRTSRMRRSRPANRIAWCWFIFGPRACGPCKMLEQNVFNQAGVGTAIEAQFVPVKLERRREFGHGDRLRHYARADRHHHHAGWRSGRRMISPPTPSAYVAELSQDRRASTRHARVSRSRRPRRCAGAGVSTNASTRRTRAWRSAPAPRQPLRRLRRRPALQRHPTASRRHRSPRHRCIRRVLRRALECRPFMQPCSRSRKCSRTVMRRM